MKKIITFFIIFTVMIPCAFADGISVYLNDKQLSFEQEPIIQNDFTLVPFRTIFEELDMTVQWFGDEQRVTAQKEGTAITLFIDKTVMYVNDKPVTLETPPIIYNDFTLVPLRAVSEAAGADVGWEEDTRTVRITAQESSFDEWAKEVLRLTNEERAKLNMPALVWDDSLASLAEEHCNDMIKRGFFSHDNPDGKTPFDRMRNAGLSYRMAGENIAAGQYSPEAALESWMNSKGHRKNILNPDFQSMGAGVVKGGKYGIYWAQEFALFN